MPRAVLHGNPEKKTNWNFILLFPEAFVFQPGYGLPATNNFLHQYFLFRKPFSFLYQESIMRSIDGYTDYKRREYCNDVKCPVQLLLNNEVEKSPKYEEIRAICAFDCLHSTHEFHNWLTVKGYLIVRPVQK